MKKIIILACFLLAPLFLYPQESIPVAPNLTNRDKNPDKFYPIMVEYPHQNTRISEEAKAIFLFGKVTPNTGVLTINGVKIPIYKNGAWLAYLPIEKGKFDFILEFNDGEKTYKAKRTILARGFNYKEYENKYRFDSDYLFPTSDLEATSLDMVEFTVSGSPNRRVKLSLGDDFRGIDMQESSATKGVYKTVLAFNKGSLITKPARVSYVMYDSEGKERERVYSNGKVRIVSPQEAAVTARVRAENVRMRPEAKPKGHILNTKLFGKVTVTGRINNLYRVALDGQNLGWLEKNYIELMPHSNPPRNIAWEVACDGDKDKTVLTVKNTEKVSFKIDQTKNSFNITLFYTQALNTVHTEVADEMIESLNYEITSDYTKKISAIYKPGQLLWGYSYKYDGNNLVFELYHRPSLFFTDKLPLRDLKILLDPGHSPKRTVPYDGAVGPTGLLEYEANYKIALAAADALRAKGAIVLLTRAENEHLDLNERAEKIDELGAHMFISIHNNALPDFVDPFAKERGFSIYYYHPQDVGLAQALEKNFRHTVGLPSEGVMEADFSVIRNSPQVPSVLIENAYMIIPYQEELLRQDRFISILADAITNGIIEYVNPQWAEKQADKQKSEQIATVATNKI